MQRPSSIVVVVATAAADDRVVGVRWQKTNIEHNRIEFNSNAVCLVRGTKKLELGPSAHN